MSYTSLNMISRAMRLLGVLASGESASASEATDGLNSLNSMIDRWSNEDLIIPSSVREVFPLVAGQQVYTMGTGGNFNTTRPISIDSALVQVLSSSPTIELPVDILTESEYANILLKGLQSTYPLALYPENTYPLVNLNLFPVPSQANNLVIYSQKPLSNFTSLTTALSLPSGYQSALEFNLAIEMAPEYGRQPSPEVIGIAESSKAAIKRKNSKPRYLRVDSAVSSSPAVWNWYTGDPK